MQPATGAGARSLRALAAALGLLWLLAGCGRAPALVDCTAAGGLHPVCGFQNPEDLAVLPADPWGGWLVVSQMARRQGGPGSAGSLLAYRPADGARRVLYPPTGEAAAPAAARAEEPGLGDPACPGPPAASAFAPHGIDLVAGPGGVRLLAVDHGGREAIEIFAVEGDGAGPSLVWRGCIPLPADAQGNDVAGLPDGSVYTTDFIPRHPSLATAWRLMRGAPTGEVLAWRPGRGWHAVPGSRSSAPNGIALSGDGRALYVSEWGAETLMRMDAAGGQVQRVGLDFHPDNLTWAPDGRLLVAGQQVSLWQMIRCRGLQAGTCGLPFRVVAVDPATLAVAPVVDGSAPAAIGAVSVALERDGRLWLGTFAGDRLAWREQQP